MSMIRLRTKKPFGLLDLREMFVVERVLEEAGIPPALRGVYYAYASAMKSKKVRSREDLEKVVQRGVAGGAREDVLRRTHQQ